MIARVAQPAGKRKVEAACQQHRHRAVDLLAAAGRDIGDGGCARRGVGAAEADAARSGRDPGIAIGAGQGVAHAGRGHQAQPRGYPKIVILAGEAAGKVK